ncbi:uncharacterized protein BCN122_I0772 [Burkholderia cenocepacia]|nr:uncharacterized protein BCN122_I0772 [Burkholderia cenocepacia]
MLTGNGARYGYARTRRKGQMVSQDRREVKYIPLIWVCTSAVPAAAA